MNSTRSSLPNLPTELVELVATYTGNKKDLLALRLTCSELSRRIQTAFTKAFYHKIETSLSVFSIQRLHHIAQQEHLREQVKELRFIPNGTFKRDMERFGSRYKNEHTLNNMFGIGYEWREGDIIGGYSLLWDCPAIQSLCDLLAMGFTNCRSFFIGADHSNWALGDYRRFDCITSFDVLAILLRVVALTGIKVQSVAVESAVYVSEEATANPASHYPPKLWDFGKFEDGWSALHSLDLEMKEHNFESDYTSPEESAKNNARILSAAKNLKRLRLSFKDDNGQTLLLRQLCTSAFSPPLSTLVLKISEVSADALTGFLAQTSRTLKTIVFQQIRLSGGLWQSVLSSLQSRSQYPDLENITIAGLAQTIGEYPQWSFRSLSFEYFRGNGYLPAPFEDERFELLDMESWYTQRGLQGIRYRGKNISAAVDELLAHFNLREYVWNGDKNEKEIKKERDFEIDEWRWLEGHVTTQRWS